MATAPSARAPWWTWAAPLLAAAATVGTLSGIPVVGWTAALVGAILIAAVFAAVFHAEVVAHRVGEPFGTLVLAVAVTIIEVALTYHGSVCWRMELACDLRVRFERRASDERD
jgi:Ca2+/H+ antiporter